MAALSSDGTQGRWGVNLIGEQLLQPPVLVFQLPQALRFVRAHPTVLRLPAVERRSDVLPR